MFHKPRHVDDGLWHVVTARKVPRRFRIKRIHTVTEFFDHCAKYQLDNHDRAMLLSSFLNISRNQAIAIIRRVDKLKMSEDDVAEWAHRQHSFRKYLNI